MDWIIENWYVVVALACVFIVAFVAILRVEKSMNKKDALSQLDKVREWLLIAVIEAEKGIGSGKGEIKLRFVFNLFVTRFPLVAHFVTFEMFSNMVDEALDKVRDMLDNDEAVKAFVEEKIK